jgi:glycosyltransferase involved in cell wall biosynthesis
MPHGELPEYLNEMQLMVLPSLTEGLPTVAIEAMACGAPVLATAVGGVPELIEDGETGFILEDNKPQTIARGIIRALGCKNLDDMVRQAHRLIEKEYTLEAAIERFRELLADLAGTQSTPRGTNRNP